MLIAIYKVFVGMLLATFVESASSHSRRSQESQTRP